MAVLIDPEPMQHTCSPATAPPRPDRRQGSGGLFGVLEQQAAIAEVFYAAATSSSSTQTKVRVLRQADDPSAAPVGALEGSCCQGAAAEAGTPLTLDKALPRCTTSTTTPTRSQIPDLRPQSQTPNPTKDREQSVDTVAPLSQRIFSRSEKE
ncbi:GD24860 [Drosophila simulans]|uniref:GD24860 n=1 Tax=Drosophila simulans TaxID=7240 RepID=B4NUN8_DROSI|nr:GD24860 [Drosophila simulans]